MTSYQCAKGCRDPKAKDGRMWHFSVNECPFETYNPKVFAGRPGKMRAKNHPGLPARPAEAPNVPAPKPAPRTDLALTGDTITFTDKKADVTKGTSKPTEPVVVDYILDGPHVKSLCNFGFRVGYFVHVRIDVWVFDWHKHLPKEQFQLTKNAEMSIDMEPRNMYARGCTWVTKYILQAKNLKDAQAAVDAILFGEAFFGIAVALVIHYEYVYRHSPKLKKKREEKARAKALKEGRVPAPVVATRTGETPEGIPVYTSATAPGVVA